MWSWLDRIPIAPLAVGATVLGLAPLLPEPHLWQKMKMLAAGTLTRPLDIFDLLFHASLLALLALRLARRGRAGQPPE
jgi:hypothetical protein